MYFCINLTFIEEIKNYISYGRNPGLTPRTYSGQLQVLSDIHFAYDQLQGRELSLATGARGAVQEGERADSQLAGWTLQLALGPLRVDDFLLDPLHIAGAL